MSSYEQQVRDPKRKRSILVRILLWINVLLALALGGSLLAPLYSPADFWPLAFLGMGWYYLTLCNACFVILWLFLWKRMSVVSLVPILLSWNNFGHLLQWNGPEKGSTEKQVKVLSYNVRLFDLYNWSKNKETRDMIFMFLRKQKADVICLQEFFDNDSHFQVLDTLLILLGKPFHHVEYTLEIRDERFGIATFSKYPIVNKGFIDFNESTNNACIYTDILKGGDTIRVYNMHLQSNRLNDEDLKFLESLGSGKEVDEIKSSEKIFSKLKKGFILRATQAETVAEHMMKCSYPKIACGDFNDSPFSYTYSVMTGDMKDAFEESGMGLGKTYNGKFPSFRIDYILHGREWRSLKFETLPERYSDHYPIYTILEPEL